MRTPAHTPRRLTALFLATYALTAILSHPPRNVPEAPEPPVETPMEEVLPPTPPMRKQEPALVAAPVPAVIAPPRPAAPIVLPRRLSAAAPVRPPVKGLVLAADQAEYYHDEFVELTLRVESPEMLEVLKSTAPPTAWIEKDGRRVVTVGEMSRVTLAFDPAQNLFHARWPVPWNAPDGEYTPRVEASACPAELPKPASVPFKVVSRPFTPLPPGFAVLTLEGYRALDRIPGPDGVKGPAGFPDWAEFIGADALFVQGGESSGFEATPPDDFPFMTASFKKISALGRACHERGLKLGVYVLSFMVGGPPEFAPHYTYGWNYDAQGLRFGLNLPKRRGISITDPKRPDDIVHFLKKVQEIPEVDWLGLDYIRPAFGSCELVDDFAAEMPGVKTPDGFEEMTPEQRMTWACRGRYSAPSPDRRAEPKFILSDQWFWYRAHRTAEVVRKIVSGLGGVKPVWAFTLSWNKGWEHGQDPCMMRDAGLEADGIMLYEADEKMFRGLVSQWGAYTKRDQLDLFVGDTVDWPLHQFSLNPSGPEAFVDRMLRAAKGFHTDGKPVRGLFFHDIHRALVGRKGPYKTLEWMLAAGHAATEVRRMNNVLPYDLQFHVSTEVVAGRASTFTAAFRGAPAEGAVTVHFYAAPDVALSRTEAVLSAEHPSVEVDVTWTPDGNSPARGNRSFAAVRAVRADKPGEHPVIQTAYFQGLSGVPAAAPPPVEEKKEEVPLP